MKIEQLIDTRKYEPLRSQLLAHKSLRLINCQITNTIL